MTTAGGEGPSGVRSLLGQGPVVALLATFGLSSAGFLCQEVALGKAIFDITHRELDLGLIGLAEFLPVALFVIVAGGVADRFDRRRVAALALLGEAVCAAALLLYIRSRPTAVGPIFAIAFAFGACRAFAAPSVRSMPADVVDEPDLPRLIALNSLSFQAALVVGPVLAGFLYAASPQLPFALSTALVTVSAVLVGTIRLRPGATAADRRMVATAAADLAAAQGAGVGGDAGDGPTLRAAFEGLRVIRSNPILLGAISLDLFAVLFGGAVALLPAIAEDRLGVGSVAFGWLRAAAGIGASIMAALLTVRPLRRNVGRTLLGAVAVFGIATLVLGTTHVYAVAFAALLVLSGADAVSVFVRSTLTPLVVPPAARGRVLAVENVFIGASNELGAFESGVAGQLLGVGGAVVLGGIATMAVAGGWWFFFPALRTVDRFEELAPDRAGP